MPAWVVGFLLEFCVSSKLCRELKCAVYVVISLWRKKLIKEICSTKLNSLSQRFVNHRTQNSVKQSAFMCDDVGLRGLRPHLEQEKIRQAYTFLGLVLAETNPAGILENRFYLLRTSKCTANAKILFPVYFLDTSLTLTLFVLWVSQAGLCCFTD